MSHLRRPTVSGGERVQVTLKLQPGLPSLRTPALKACVEQAIDAGHERFGMRLLGYTLEKDGLALLVTAPHRRALSRGIQGISVRIARAVNRKLERKGRLFADRYDAQLLADIAKASGGKAHVIKAAVNKAAVIKAAKAAVTKAAVIKAAVSKPAVNRSSVSKPATKPKAPARKPAAASGASSPRRSKSSPRSTARA